MGLTDLMPVLMEDYFIKVIFLVHATMSSLANLSACSYNFILLAAILLAVHDNKNPDIVLLAAAFNVVCIALDVLALIVIPHLGVDVTLLIVLNLIFRPLSSILLLRNYSARAGVADPTNGLLEVHTTMPKARSAYQNIDEPMAGPQS